MSDRAVVAPGLVLLTVAARRAIAERITELTLQAEDGGPLPTWTPGSHIDLHLGNGMVRQYSLCGDPRDEGSWRVAVLREEQGRGGSCFLHESLDVGATMTASLPRNHFDFGHEADVVFIAGGIGITPLLPMMEVAEQQQLTWHLYYGGRHAGSMAYADELMARYPGRVTVYAESVTGLIDLEAVAAKTTLSTAVYCCGPSPLLAAVTRAFARWPADSVRFERFAPDPEAGATAPEGTFEVVFEQSGVTAEVPVGKSIVEVAESNGVPVITSCEEGVCGSCETRVLAGRADHRDSILSEHEKKEGDTMMICVSRSLTRQLVLAI